MSRELDLSNLTEGQMKALEETYKYLCAMVAGRPFDNASPCSVFHVNPFNTHWDDRTVNEIIYHIHLYVTTWVMSPLEKEFGFKQADEDKKMLLNWHKSQAYKLESELKEKQT